MGNFRKNKPKWTPDKLSKIYGNNWAWFKPAPIKEARRNLLTYSQDFNQSPWVKYNNAGTITANSILAPDNTLTADTWEHSTPDSNTMILVDTTVSSGQTVFGSIYVKKDIGQWIRFAIFNTTYDNGFGGWFDLDNGIIGTSGAIGTGVHNFSTIIADVNGFYRFHISGNIPATTVYRLMVAITTTGSAPTRLNNGKCYLWGAQLETTKITDYQRIDASWDATYSAKYPVESQYQDSTATTAITTVGQSVGFVSDYRGFGLGPELISNGTFNIDTNGWTAASGAILSLDNQHLLVTNGSTWGYAYCSFNATIGKFYRVEYTFCSGTGTAHFKLGTGAPGGQDILNVINSSGVATSTVFYFTSTASTIYISCGSHDTIGQTSWYDNISVREVANPYAIQATAANRPTYQLDSLGIPVLRHDTNDGLTVTVPAGFSGIGPEIAVNGDFSNGSTGWSIGTGWSITGGQAVANNALNYSIGQNNTIPVDTSIYLMCFDVVVTSGTVGVRIGSAAYSNDLITASGSYSRIYQSYGTISTWFFAAYSFTGTIDNVSIRKVYSLASLYYANQFGVQQLHSLPIYDSYTLPGKSTTTSNDVYEYILLPSRPNAQIENSIIKYLGKQVDTIPADWTLTGSTYWRRHQRSRNTNQASTADELITPTGTYPGSMFVGGVLLSDGRVFSIPYASTTARIYNPATDTLSTPIGTYPGGSAFYGGVLLSDGRVFCVPYGSTTARIYNPVTDTLSTPTGTYPGSAFVGGVLLPDGRVFCVPFSSTTARIYNPVTDTLSTPTGTYPPSNAFIGGVLLPDGRVFCVPFYSTTARIYNPITDTLTTPTGTYPGNYAFTGGVLLPDGRVFCVPYNSTTARIYNPITDTLSTPTGTYPGITSFHGGVLLPDGRVFCIPNNSSTARIYDPITDTLTTPTGTYPGSNAFVGGVLLFDGRVFCIPYTSTTARIYNGGYPKQTMTRVLSAYDNKL